MAKRGGPRQVLLFDRDSHTLARLTRVRRDRSAALSPQRTPPTRPCAAQTRLRSVKTRTMPERPVFPSVGPCHLSHIGELSSFSIPL